MISVRSSATVKRKARQDGGVAGLEQRLEALAGIRLRVGPMGPNGTAAPMYRPEPGEANPNVDIATMLAWHEFGLVPGTPARPFMRSWSRVNRRRLQDQLRRIARAAARGQDARAQAEREGELMAGSLRRHLLDGIDPGLAEATLRETLPRVVPLASEQVLATIRHHVEDV